jgi:pilus assembly protein TadC
MRLLERYLSLRRAKALESQLALFLLSLRAKLLTGLTLESSLRKLKEEFGSPISEEIDFILKELDKGRDISDALMNSASKTQSLEFKRVLSHLNEIARSGYSEQSDTLKLLCDELVALQKARIRDYSAKLAVLSLLFIAASVIMPALWLAFVTMGSAFFALNIDVMWVWISTTILFPALSAFILIYIKEKAP